MTSPVISVEDTADVEEIARLIEKHKIERVVVLNSGITVGILSRADIARAVAAKMDAVCLTSLLWEQGKAFVIDRADPHRLTK